MKRYSQTTQKVNVWAGILVNHIVGSSFIEGNLSGDTYLSLLQECADPMITKILGNYENLLDKEKTFRQDGAPPDFDVRV